MPALRLLQAPLASLALLAAAGAAQGATEPALDPAQPALTCYTNITLIDGSGMPARPAMAVEVDGERIRAVLPIAALPARTQPGMTVVDLKGAWVLPGLVDTHEHVGTSPNRRVAEANLRRCLYGGITAMRDMAGDARFLAELAREARLGEIASPDIHYSALMAGPGFFNDPRTHMAARGAQPGAVPWLQAITPKTDLRTAVTLARGCGASGIKVYADLSPELIAAIVAEAHRQNFPVWSHATVFPSLPADSVAAGVDSISHAYLLGYPFMVPTPNSYATKLPVDPAKVHEDDPRLQKLFAEMRRRGTILDATLTAYVETDRQAGAKSLGRGAIAERLAAAAYRAGVLISVGTDHAGAPDSPAPALNEEMELLVEKAGMSPADVVHAATQVGARALKLDAEMGTVEPGKLANLLVVAKNPLADIRALREVILTVKRGKAYPRIDYHQPAPDDLDGVW